VEPALRICVGRLVHSLLFVTIAVDLDVCSAIIEPGWIPSFIETEMSEELDFIDFSAESFAALQRRVGELEEIQQSQKTQIEDLTKRMQIIEKRVSGSTAGKIAFVDRDELDRFVAEHSRLVFSEGVKKMEDLNWDVPKMMRKLRSFFSTEEYQGSAFWFTMAAQTKYFKTAPVRTDAASKDGRRQIPQARATGHSYGPAPKRAFARGARGTGRPFQNRSQQQLGGRRWY
jgi:hypothetical protein